MKEFVMSKDSPIVSTPKGKLRGFRFDGVDHFYGIRYAKAKRFQMPEPVPAWEGVKDAGSYGMNCPVLSEPMPTGEVLIPHRFWPSSEHCQYLNLWTKSCEPSAKRPVLFWIHGGGYASGSGMEQICYDGFNLAKDDDVGGVTVNHRLNAFGYLDLSAFGEKYWNSVNVGMADLVEALRWVRDNIACFGGDPDNVTIFGQSGGGGKVTVLGQIPEAEGLFHKMIVMSGVITGHAFDTDCTPKELVLEILGNLNIPEAEVLWGRGIATKRDMEAAAGELSERFGVAVLVKGGHGISDADDVLAERGFTCWLPGERIENDNTHGTGCTLSSAIACGLAKGFTVFEACEYAKRYISGALAAQLDLGKGSGPLDHMWEYRGR